MAARESWFMKGGRWTTAGAWTALLLLVLVVYAAVMAARWAMGMGSKPDPANVPDDPTTDENATGTGPKPPTPEQAQEWAQGVLDAWNQTKDWFRNLDFNGEN